MKRFLSYGKQLIDDSDIAAVVDVLKSDYLTQGPAVAKFEKKLCEITGAKYAVAVSNGTAALHIAVLALELESGSEGVTTPITFAASSNCMLYSGVKPKFADIEKDSYNIDPEKIEELVNENTKLIVPVHLAGHPCKMEKIKKIKDKYSLYVIEDASHAIGGFYADKTPVGNCKYSDMTVFSFHPVKTITTCEGGAVTTNSREFYEKLLMLRSHGITKDPSKLSQNPGPWYYEMQMLGYNYRLSDVHAALGVSQLAKLDRFSAIRRDIVSFYNNSFKDTPFVKRPKEDDGVESCFHLYLLLIDFKALNKTRKDVMEKLKMFGIGTQVHYIPLYRLPYYAENLGYKGTICPNAEKYYKSTLSIPLFPDMTKEEVKYVAETIKKVLND